MLEDGLDSALGLVVDDRAVVAERLLASLDDLDERETDRLWREEAQWRLAAFRTGKARARPAKDVYARAERLLKSQDKKMAEVRPNRGSWVARTRGAPTDRVCIVSPMQGSSERAVFAIAPARLALAATRRGLGAAPTRVGAAPQAATNVRGWPE